MTLCFLDSFDHYTTMAQKWTNAPFGSIVVAAVRTGTYGYRMATQNQPGANITINNQATWIVGVGFRTNSFATGGEARILLTLDAGATQGALRWNVDGTLSLLRGATVVATSAFSLLVNTYYYIEFKHVIDPAAGTLEVRVNGAVWATFAGNTRQTANSFANGIQLGFNPNTGGVNMDYDDIYINDGNGGAPNNTYWGDTQVNCLLPTGAGTYTEFTTLVGAATHWQATNEVPPNDDTSYIASQTIDQRDTYAFSNLPSSGGTVNGIQHVMRPREDMAGARKVARLYYDGASMSTGADTAINTSYMYIREILSSDPIGGGVWTPALINAAEFGVKAR